MSGFVAMQRDALDHPLLKDGERFRAWFWLVANAAWKPTRARIKGQIVTLERGELSFSQRFLAEAWGWSKSRVDRFVADLREEGMIETRSKIGATAGHNAGQGQSIITICNYDKYQTPSEDARGNVEPDAGATAGQQRGKEEQGNKGTSIPSSNDDGLSAAEITKAIFDTGIIILGEAGTAEPQARSLIGMWRKRYRDGPVLAVLGRCPRNLSEPREWITKALQAEVGNGRESAQTGKRNGIADALDREIGLGEPPGAPERRAIGGSGPHSVRAIAGPAAC